jgi:hypothetical protein
MATAFACAGAAFALLSDANFLTRNRFLKRFGRFVRPLSAFLCRS